MPGQRWHLILNGNARGLCSNDLDYLQPEAIIQRFEPFDATIRSFPPPKLAVILEDPTVCPGDCHCYSDCIFKIVTVS
jgi:hypothetical protein